MSLTLRLGVSLPQFVLISSFVLAATTSMLIREEYSDTLNTNITGYRIIEGDILIEDEIVPNSAPGEEVVQDSGIAFQNSRWQNGQIPFVISNDFGAWERAVIYGAMNEIMSKTCIRFIERKWESHFVFIQKHYGRVCNSVVGRSAGRTPQLLTLGNGCVNHWTVLHELTHVIGFYHEHNRVDRDNYVSILWGNIPQGNHHDFQKQGNTYDFGVGYDYNSIMHYGPTYFGFAGRTTMISKISGMQFGNAKHLSFRDILKINRMYSCRNTRAEN